MKLLGGTLVTIYLRFYNIASCWTSGETKFIYIIENKISCQVPITHM